MDHSDVIDILLVEDNPRDAELTIRAIRKRNIVNPFHTVEDGATALEEIEKNKGVFYDPDAVEACLRLIRDKGYKFE